MQQSIDIGRDMAGVKLAAIALMEEGFAFSRLEKSIEGADDEMRRRMLETLPPRSMTPGYYRMGEYLLWLDQHVRAGVTLNSVRLAAFEADGLCAIESARNEFESAHPACGACGARQDNRFAFQCHECGVEFKGR